MKSKTFVMMFVAIGCGLVAAYLTARLTARGAAQNTVPVLVAKERIKAGDIIKEPELLFVEMQYPAGSTPNAIASMETLKNKIVNKTIQQGQWVTPDDLSTNFGIELPKGFYAMAVKVSAETAAGGFILPKSKVNILATIKDPRGTQKNRVVTVLQDVLVLAIDQSGVRPDDKLAVSTLSTATLAVKPTEAQRLSLAQSMGELRLVLRAHDDDSKSPLQPLDKLEWDSGMDGMFGTDDERKTFKLAFAKEDLQVGQFIEDPEKVFVIKEMPFAPEKAITVATLAELKGKTVRHTIFKDTMVTTKAFEGENLPTATASAPKVKRHVMFVQNGGNEPKRFEYRDGLFEGGDKGTDMSPPSSDESSEEKPGKGR
jgi:pilus assembly protein CpaB